MIDFSLVNQGMLTTPEFVTQLNLTIADLRQFTNESADRMLDLISDCSDADVTFVPSDPNANDTFATNPDDVDLAWTLGHVIAHTTASAEESAYLAVELARGVAYRGGRSRYEVPWHDVTTISQCRGRLEESRRMRLASLDMWPQPPHLENVYIVRDDLPPYNAFSRFVTGLRHDDAHFEQIEAIVAQARKAREVNES
jgi:hypothetical protein